MKQKYILYFSILLLTNHMAAQSSKAISYLSKLNFKAVTDNYLFISATEVSNGQYLEYLNWLKKNEGIISYSKMLPDTSVWKDKLTYNEPYVAYYFRHPAYRDYPVVGVSWEQAVAYCRWKAARTMESKEFKTSGLEKISLRLPSEKEWMKAARGCLPEDAIYTWAGDKIRWTDGKKKDNGKIRLNCKRDAGDQGGIAGNVNDAAFITTPVSSYWPNTIGLYNMCGNVAEWVEEKNMAKGGSWNSLPYNTRIDIAPESVKGSMASSTIGFRPVLEIISVKKNPKKSTLTLTPRMLEKQIKMLDDSLGAAIYETSNQLYNLYLNETNSLADSIHGSGWSKYFRYAYFRNYDQNPQFNNYPVVNISYESAEHFCEWLTKRYNQSKNRKYKEVVFRLPTPIEWVRAALGKKNGLSYPWDGPYFRDSKGCFMANFSPLEEEFLSKNSTGKVFYNYPNNDSCISRGIDGSEFTAPVNAYYPNSLGLYNCAGNVAEMTLRKGISKGGSWTSSQYFITIGSNETYTGSDANLGFRFFMEVKQH